MWLSKFKLAGNLAKTVGYMAYGINQVLRLAGSTARKMGDAINDKPLYNIQVVNKTTGEITREYSRVNYRKITEILQSLHDLESRDYEVKTVLIDE
jgi:hypothetical protein|tara:strand:+ start:352 stop:639 length:288 start_codon:yes stop_codon:yes gene_type:complete